MLSAFLQMCKNPPSLILKATCWLKVATRKCLMMEFWLSSLLAACQSGDMTFNTPLRPLLGQTSSCRNSI